MVSNLLRLRLRAFTRIGLATSTVNFYLKSQIYAIFLSRAKEITFFSHIFFNRFMNRRETPRRPERLAAPKTRPKPGMATYAGTRVSSSPADSPL